MYLLKKRSNNFLGWDRKNIEIFSIKIKGWDVYVDDTFLGSCRPAIFNLVVVQFFRKKKEGAVQFQTRFFYYMEMSKTGDVLFLEHRKYFFNKEPPFVPYPGQCQDHGYQSKTVFSVSPNFGEVCPASR